MDRATGFTSTWGMFGTILLVQGVYYLITGLWPIVGIGSFLMITGPKADLWLVKTVGLLITVISLALLAASWRREISIEIVGLAIGTALILTGVDLFYVRWHVISPIYLADAVLELALLAWWGFAFFRMRQTGRATA